MVVCVERRASIEVVRSWDPDFPIQTSIWETGGEEKELSRRTRVIRTNTEKNT